MSTSRSEIRDRLKQDIELAQQQIQELFEGVDLEELPVARMRKLLKRLEGVKVVIEDGCW